jgi:hypothetical protein
VCVDVRTHRGHDDGYRENHLKSLVIPLSLTVSLIACTSGPVLPNYAGADASCIKGDTANLIRAFSEGEAHVSIKEIDGLPTGRGEPYCVSPGKHRLGISAYIQYQAAQDYVDLDLAAGRQYSLRANLRGISFVFQLIDVTEQPEKKLSEFNLRALPSGGGTIPIFIPAR